MSDKDWINNIIKELEQIKSILSKNTDDIEFRIMMLKLNHWNSSTKAIFNKLSNLSNPNEIILKIEQEIKKLTDTGAL